MEEIKEIEPREGKYRTFECIQHHIDGSSRVFGELILIGEKLYFDGASAKSLLDSRGLEFWAKKMKEQEKKIKNGF